MCHRLPPQLLIELSCQMYFFSQELYQSLLHNFVQAGGEDDIRGVNQLRRIMFSILMEVHVMTGRRHSSEQHTRVGVQNATMHSSKL